MSASPLNQAVIAQVLHDLRTGQLKRCESMGFTPDTLAAFKQPTTISMLANARVPWCSVRVNQSVLQRLLGQVRDVETEIAAIDRMLNLGASTEMMAEFYGLTHAEVALRRQVLRLPVSKGRRRVLTESQDAALWTRWRDEVVQRELEVDNTRAMLDVAMTLAEEKGVALCVVWSAVRSWIEQAAPSR